MIFIINVIALYASFSLNQTYAVYWGGVLPVLYAIVLAPHALIGRSAKTFRLTRNAVKIAP